MIKTLFLLIIFLFVVASSFGQTIEEINAVTNDFLKTLNEQQLQQVSLSFNDTSRTKWTNLPVGLAPRPGLQYGELSADSKILFHHILTTLLSSQGYLKTTSIMKLDDILNEVYETAYKYKEISDDEILELRNLQWDFSHYFISIWGKPGIFVPWGLKFEGHHISLNLSAAREKYSLTPLFFGTDPSEVHTTKYAGLRVLSKEEDNGFKLINSLSKEQQKVAVISTKVPEDIITNPQREQMISEYNGIKASSLTPEQKVFLKYIIEEYVNNLEHEKAHEYMHKFEKSGIDNIWFGWIGSFEPQKPHYYIINGPDFLIEYDNMGFQNNGNHIHSIWREKGNDFGEDILKTHYLEHKH
jgi:hypothetical protein